MERRCAALVEAAAEREEEEGDDEEGAVGVAREGREGPQGFEGPQRGLPAQTGRGREVDGEEAHRQRLETRRKGPEDSGPCSVPGQLASALNLRERGPLRPGFRLCFASYDAGRATRDPPWPSAVER